MKNKALFKALTSWFGRYRWDLLIAVILIGVYLFTRLVSLTDLPIFVDEAIYLRWAQIAKNDANWRFISLTDGKQPLFVWLVMVALRFFQDPLVAGRLVSTAIGIGSIGLLWLLSFTLFKSRKISWLTTLFYLISPFTLIYDRMVLMDNLVAFFSLLSLWLAILLVKTRRLDVALLLGGAIGGAVLNKTSGFLNIYLLPMTLILFDLRQKNRVLAFLKWAGLALLAAVIALVIYGVLRLSPFFHIISEKNSLFVFPLWEWMKSPFYYFWSNFKGMANWLVIYLTPPWLMLAIFSLGSTHIKTREKLLLFGWFFVPFMGLVTMGRILYPRFILFMSLPLLILAAFSVVRLWGLIRKGYLYFLLILFVFTWSIYASLTILSEPSVAPIPTNDMGQYVKSWPAGYGINNIVAFAQREAQDKQIYLATEGTFGLMPASLELYLWHYPNITLKGFFPIEKLPEEVLESAKARPTYIVFNETVEPPFNWPLKLISEYPRPDPKRSMKLYQVLDRPAIDEED